MEFGPAPVETRRLLIGQMCPQAAAGRPAVRGLFLGPEGWRGDPTQAAVAITRRLARQFSVLGWGGGRVGTFSVMGAVELGKTTAATGSFSGQSPCLRVVELGEEPEEIPACVAAQAHCAVAVSALEPSGGWAARPFYEEPEAPFDVPTGELCADDDGRLTVDVDGDGSPELFDSRHFLSKRGLAGEVLAAKRKGAPCRAGRFATAAVATRQGVELDVLAVADFDGNGRFELLVAARGPDRTTWALYEATTSAARLDRVAQATVW